MRTNMTTLTHIWMRLLLRNILPSIHNYDLPLLKWQFVYAILTQVSVHVAQLISDALYQFAGIAPKRHPMDSEKSNRALGFLLWFLAFVSSTECPSPPARSSDRLLIGPSSRNTAPPGRLRAKHHDSLGTANSRQLRMHHHHLLRLERCIRHVADQQVASHRGQVWLNESFYQYTLCQ